MPNAPRTNASACRRAAELLAIQAKAHTGRVRAEYEALGAQLEQAAKDCEQFAALTAVHEADDWHEDDGAVLWWSYPIAEPPYSGTALDRDFPEHRMTHWTRIHVPPALCAQIDMWGTGTPETADA